MRKELLLKGSWSKSSRCSSNGFTGIRNKVYSYFKQFESNGGKEYTNSMNQL